jgi:hypothetical protein
VKSVGAGRRAHIDVGAARSALLHVIHAGVDA